MNFILTKLASTELSIIVSLVFCCQQLHFTQRKWKIYMHISTWRLFFIHNLCRIYYRRYQTKVNFRGEMWSNFCVTYKIYRIFLICADSSCYLIFVPVRATKEATYFPSNASFKPLNFIAVSFIKLDIATCRFYDFTRNRIYSDAIIWILSFHP